MACESLIPWSGTVAAVHIVRVFPERIWIAGAPRKLATEAVSMRITVVATTLPIPVVIAQTYHTIRVRDHWSWILSPEQYAYYSARTLPLCLIQPTEGCLPATWAISGPATYGWVFVKLTSGGLTITP